MAFQSLSIREARPAGSGRSRLGRLALGMMLAMVLGGALRAGAAEPSPLDPAWKQALAPLAKVPVQDYGCVRSVYTFGESHLGAIVDKSSFRGMDAMESVLYLMANPEAAQTLPLIKVVRPEFQRLLGGKLVPLNRVRGKDTEERIKVLVGNDQKLIEAYEDIETRAGHLEKLEENFAIIPRAGDKADWLSPAGIKAPVDPAIEKSWADLKQALRQNNPQAGGQAAQALADAVFGAATREGVRLPRLGLDYFYHHHQPFRKASVFYLLAALAFGGSLLLGRKGLGWVGYALMALGFTEQVVGVTARWILAGRAPLSNMYESFTFAIGGMILVALVFELIYKNRLAGLGGAVLGFIFMVLADKAPIFDSQIRPLMPALQSSWLTYHVVVIMLSYSAFALSFFVSVAYLVKDALGGDATTNGLLRRLPSLEALDLFNYKLIAVGFPLLTLGIIFGAVWAATAWGRPWGFDPKETWSAITWLIYAIYLHARFLAGWKGRLAAVLSLIGFAGVLFTYLGVNYLLPGLHSYV